MSDMGHDRLFRSLELSSALPLQADLNGSPRLGRFVPQPATPDGFTGDLSPCARGSPTGHDDPGSGKKPGGSVESFTAGRADRGATARTPGRRSEPTARAGERRGI